MAPLVPQVFVDGGDKYHIESCEPAVADIDELIQSLNSDNDFSAFVRIDAWVRNLIASNPVG